MDTEEAVPTAMVFEEVDDDQEEGRKNHVNIAFRHTADADGSNNGVVFALNDGQDVNVVVEEGGSTSSNDDYDQPGYTMIRHEEVKVMREELEQAKQTVERQLIEMDKAKEMIMEQENRIAELEEDKKKHEMGMGRGEGGEKSTPKGEKEEKKNGSSLKGRIEDLEETVDHLKKVVKEKEEQLHQKELTMLQKDAEHDIVKKMNSAEVSMLKKLLSEEREKRVIAEMQVKMLLGSIEPVEYLKSNRERENVGKKTATDLPLTQRTPPPPVSASSQTENVTVDDGGDDDDDDVMFIEEVEKECASSGEVADADSGYPRCDSENESEKVNDLMNQKFVCKVCGLVCTTNLNLVKHIRTTHGQPFSQLQSNANANRTETETVTLSPISGPSTSTSPHNLRRRNASGTVSINHIRRSSSSSSTSSANGNWSSQENTNSKGNGKFICTLCEERYPIVSKLKQHMKHTHGIEDDRFSIGCKDCGIIFYNRRDHIFHRRITHGTRYNGRRPNSLTRPSSSGNHSNSTMPETNDEEALVLSPEAGSSTQTFKNHAVDVNRLSFGCFCTCGLEFRKTSHIKIHIKLCNKSDRMSPQIPTSASNAVSHEDTGPGTQGEEFESKMVIDENGMRILTIEPPSPPLPSIQQRHRLVDVDPKLHRAKYHCSCGNVYYNRASFQIHAKSKNMGRIFKCGWCSMSFDLHGNLKSHVRAFHKAIYGNGKFACGTCAQTFDTSRQLFCHRKQDCMKKQ